jgi:hypothetical protein
MCYIPLSYPGIAFCSRKAKYRSVDSDRNLLLFSCGVPQGAPARRPGAAARRPWQAPAAAHKRPGQAPPQGEFCCREWSRLGMLQSHGAASSSPVASVSAMLRGPRRAPARWLTRGAMWVRAGRDELPPGGEREVAGVAWTGKDTRSWTPGIPPALAQSTCSPSSLAREVVARSVVSGEERCEQLVSLGRLALEAGAQRGGVG